MVVLKERNYKEEIIKIIKMNGGYIKGFNKLRRIGNFHTNMLQLHLEELESQNIITIIKSKSGRKYTKYYLIKPHFGFKIRLNERDIQRILQLKHNAETHEEKIIYTGNLIHLVFHKYQNIVVGKLCSKLLDNYPMSYKDLKIVEERYWNIILNALNELKERDGRRILNSLFERYPKMSILEK